MAIRHAKDQDLKHVLRGTMPRSLRRLPLAQGVPARVVMEGDARPLPDLADPGALQPRRAGAAAGGCCHLILSDQLSVVIML